MRSIKTDYSQISDFCGPSRALKANINFHKSLCHDARLTQKLKCHYLYKFHLQELYQGKLKNELPAVILPGRELSMSRKYTVWGFVKTRERGYSTTHQLAMLQNEAVE